MNLIKILQGDIELIDVVNIRDVALFEDHVFIYPKDIRVMLNQFLNGDLSAEDLTKWAEFICLLVEYTIPNWEDDEIADYYEDMWYTMQRLSTPEIDSEITIARVKQYLAELVKYKNDP